ncbi:MAG: class I SAM-dependent methyltransferase [Actinomycetota bacterium]
MRRTSRPRGRLGGWGVLDGCRSNCAASASAARSSGRRTAPRDWNRKDPWYRRSRIGSLEVGGCDMTITVDREDTQTRALFEFADLDGRHVLEIGCGDGRFTWRYADKAAYVTAIDPDTEQIALAVQGAPAHLRDRVRFRDISFEDFAAAGTSSSFDTVILSWALC